MKNDIVVDAVVITALLEERDAIVAKLQDVQVHTMRKRVYTSGTVDGAGPKRRVVVLSLPLMGNVSAAVAVSQAIDVWNPKYVFVTGIAGGVPKGPERSLGDIIVAQQIVGYELAKVRKGVAEPRFQVYRASFELLEKARTLPPGEWIHDIGVARPDGTSVSPNVHVGVIASGEKVVADAKFVAELKKSWPQLTGIEMEGLGAALAAYEAATAPELLLVKGICDWADRHKNDDWHAYAAAAAAAFTIALIRHIAAPQVATPQATKVTVAAVQLSGKNKIKLCQRLGGSWSDLADYFNIPPHEQAKFAKGYECKAIWEWLEIRNKLGALKDALEFIGRDDLEDALDAM